jgi:hypothetical protein
MIKRDARWRKMAQNATKCHKMTKTEQNGTKRHKMVVPVRSTAQDTLTDMTKFLPGMNQAESRRGRTS